ncbi:hypothetical protein CPC08DRAFT_730869 [Agrocybe pediades]|nr:hypothetical protein CPC08DRAFT_730869 [Agrocybe pediades]
MTTPKTQNKGSSSKPHSASGSKAPPVNSESISANKKPGHKKRVTIKEIQPDSQSIGLTLNSRTGGPILELAAQAALSAASETRGPTWIPSSLVHNDNSVNSEHTVHAEQTESSPIFRGIPVAKEIPIYDEPIHDSIVRYHEAYDPLTDRDPLEEFGAVNGYLPDRPAEEAMMLWDIVICWSYPHLHHQKIIFDQDAHNYYILHCLASRVTGVRRVEQHKEQTRPVSPQIPAYSQARPWRLELYMKPRQLTNIKGSQSELDEPAGAGGEQAGLPSRAGAGKQASTTPFPVGGGVFWLLRLVGHRLRRGKKIVG